MSHLNVDSCDPYTTMVGKSSEENGVRLCEVIDEEPSKINDTQAVLEDCHKQFSFTDDDSQYTLDCTGDITAVELKHQQQYLAMDG